MNQSLPPAAKRKLHRRRISILLYAMSAALAVYVALSVAGVVVATL
jgi:hypothetical protein